MKTPHLTSTQVLSYLLFLLSALILVASIMLTANVKVLKDWTLVIPNTPMHLGDTVTIKSEYTKLRDVSGKATRYIECQNKSKAYVRYPLNEAVANRASGKGGTGIVVTIPTAIPDVPTTCKFTIAIAYDVYPWKKVNHTQSSNTFLLLAKDLVENPTTLPEGPALSSVALPGPSFASSSNSTPTSQQTQQVTSQQTDATPVDSTPPKDESKPGLVKRIISTIGL